MTLDQLKDEAARINSFIVSHLWAKALGLALASATVGWIAGRVHWPF